MSGSFGQKLTVLNYGDMKKVVGYHWSRKYNGYSVIWDGGVTTGMLAKDVPWFYPSRVDSTGLRSTGLWTLGRNPKDSKKPLPKVVVATDDFISRLYKQIGNIPCHGELWYNDDIQFVKKGARLKKPSQKFWDTVQYKIFSVKPYGTFHRFKELEGLRDDPTRQLFLSSLRARRYYMYLLKKNFSSGGPASIIEQRPCNSLTQVADVFTLFKTQDWEGLVFTDMDTPYENKRTNSVYKYKPIYEDTAIVVDYTEGKKRHEGRAGALVVNMTLTDNVENIHGVGDDVIGKNITFKISGGLTDRMREWENITNSYPVGCKIDFSFNYMSVDGIPQHCTIIGEGYGG